MKESPSRSEGNDAQKCFTEFTHCQNFFTAVRKQLERVIALVLDRTKLLIWRYLAAMCGDMPYFIFWYSLRFLCIREMVS